MKYIINESRLNSTIKRFIKKSLGEYREEPLKSRRNLGYQGNFYDDNGKIIGSVGSGTYRMMVDQYEILSKMFNIGWLDLDQLLVEVVNEVVFPYKVTRVSYLIS